MDFDIVKIETFIPEEYFKTLREELNKIGALTIGGCYDNCISISEVNGYFRPLTGANPFSDKAGELYNAKEYKVEFCCKKEMYKEAVETIKMVHPYETPVINVLPVICNGL